MAERLRDKHKARLVTAFNGDITDGNHHGTTQILSGNPVVQSQVVNACMQVPLALGPDRMVFIRGTEAHVGKSAAYEERIADGLCRDGRPVIRDDEQGTASHWKWRAVLEDVFVEFAHHGRMGTRSWTKPNVVLNLAADIFMEYAKDGEAHPKLAVRSHYHRYVDTYDAHPVRVVQTPAWQLSTAFIHRIGAETMADIGGIFVLIEDDQFEVLKYIHKPTRPKIWREP